MSINHLEIQNPDKSDHHKKKKISKLAAVIFSLLSVSSCSSSMRPLSHELLLGQLRRQIAATMQLWFERDENKCIQDKDSSWGS